MSFSHLAVWFCFLHPKVPDLKPNKPQPGLLSAWDAEQPHPGNHHHHNSHHHHLRCWTLTIIKVLVTFHYQAIIILINNIVTVAPSNVMLQPPPVPVWWQLQLGLHNHKVAGFQNIDPRPTTIEIEKTITIANNKNNLVFTIIRPWKHCPCLAITITKTKRASDYLSNAV